MDALPVYLLEPHRAAENRQEGDELRYVIEMPQGSEPAELEAQLRALMLGVALSVTRQFESQEGSLDQFYLLTLPEYISDEDKQSLIEFGYALAAALGAISVEADLNAAFYPEIEPGVGPQPEGVAGGFPGCWVPHEPPTDAQWAPKLVRAIEAWALFPECAQGEGITIGQPDTGLANHDEFRGAHVAPQLGYNFVEGQPNGTDPLTTAWLTNPGHGTGTASVVVSPSTLQVTGSAPKATLIPIRCLRRIVVLEPSRLAQAIDFARNRGCDVVTMSMGGLPGRSLHAALQAAVNAGMIVLAAAGNCVRSVVYPARYDECIAVAGVNQARKMWKGSCRGSAVDVSGPAELVYRARRTPDSQATDVVGHGQGTSFAVAITAGIAALWLKKHGRENVRRIAAARMTSVQFLFLAALQQSAVPGGDWDDTELGPGIVDAVALLGVDLNTVPLRSAIHAESLSPPLRSDLYGLVIEAVGDGSTSGAPIQARFEQEIATLALERIKAQAASNLTSEAVPASSQDLKVEVAHKDANGPLARLVGAY